MKILSFIYLFISSMSFALNVDFNPPAGWKQPQPKLASQVWQHPDNKDIKLTYLGYEHPAGFKKMSNQEAKKFVAAREKKRSEMNQFVGISNWAVKKFDITDYGKGQLLKLQGQYKDNDKNIQFQEWVYFAPDQQQEVQIVYPEGNKMSQQQADEYLQSLKVKK